MWGYVQVIVSLLPTTFSHYGTILGTSNIGGGRVGFHLSEKGL